MVDLRFDVAPLPITELAPIRLESSALDEPFVLGAGAARVAGYCGLALNALRAGRNRDFVNAAGADVHAVITPCGVVRTARIDGVLVTERIASLGAHAGAVTQWTVDADAELVLGGAAGAALLPGVHTLRLAAGQTATATPRIETAAGRCLPNDVAQAFRSAAGSLARAVRAGLQLETSDGTGSALAWAKARLWTHAPAASAGGVADITASLAAMVVGRPEQARADLERLPPVFLPLLAARYAAWTGDLQGLGAFRRQFPEGRALLRNAPDDDDVAAVWFAGLAGLERTAADLGDPTYAADLQSALNRARAELAGRALSADGIAILTALRAPGPATAFPRWIECDDVPRHSWLTWAALEQGSMRDGRAGWHRLLTQTGVPVRGALPRRFGTTDDDVDATALFVLTLAHGVLGIEPDAPRHRIRIAPRLATAADSLEAHGIPCGDGSLSLGVCLDERAIILRIAQDAGAIPLTAVLEPVVEGRVTAAWVDGRAAALDVRPHGTATAVPVQLVLDAERTLRIERARND